MEEFVKHYLYLLNTKFLGLNLTNIKDPKEFYDKQVLDSMLPFEDESFAPRQLMTKHKMVIDVGFGGGFPLLPLAWCYPDIQFIGFEARRKKADAVRTIADDLGLTNVLTFHERIENIKIDRSALITFKAVGKIFDYLEKINASNKIYPMFYKGPRVDELEDFNKVLLGWNEIDRLDYRITNGERTLITLENKNVPCGTLGKSNKKVVKLSDLI